jgi:gluconate 2-dehydrogenase gamma chain
MTDKERPSNPRRAFLTTTVGLAGVGALLPAALSSGAPVTAQSNAAPNEAAPPYQSLGPDEATFVEALVNVMCPADEHSPNGADCGLATYIDRQLAGPYGKGAGRYQRGPFRLGKPELGWQLPLSPEQFCKTGIAAANAASLRLHGQPFGQLSLPIADRFLIQIQDGIVVDEHVPLASWFNDIIYPLFVEGCFADPMYGGNRDAVFWKMIGYPGLPATHTLDMVRYRGQSYPHSNSPKSIVDFT